MEQERLRGINEEKRKAEEKILKQEEYSKNLKDQLIMNEEERLLDLERRREETRLINLNSIVQQEAELERLKNRANESEKLKKELYECNERLKHFKAMEEEENRIMDIR